MPEPCCSTAGLMQQRLPAWRPLLEPKWVISSIGLVGFCFIILGIALLAAASGIVEVRSYNYFNNTNDTSVGASPTITLTIPAGGMKQPIFLYYELSHFYQNHRRYVRSRNDLQLAGVPIKDYSDPAKLNAGNYDCAPRIQYNPCGFIANSVFSDTFTDARLNNNTVILSEEGVAFPWEYQKFKETPGFPSTTAPNIPVDRMVQWNQSVISPEFMVWMHPSFSPTFRKLHRRITTDLPAGTFTITANIRYPQWAGKTTDIGERRIILTSRGAVGGKNYFLGALYLASGLVMLCVDLGFLVKQKAKPRVPADSRYLVF